MGIKKIARPINSAKNKFIDWLNKNNAELIDVYEGKRAKEWDYYRSVSAFIDDALYIVYFQMWEGEIKINYSDEENSYNNLSINDFLELIK